MSGLRAGEPGARGVGAPASVSICIPTYNRSVTLRRTLCSVSEQTYEPLEVVVSDNASRDDTEAVCSSFTGQLRLTYVRQPAAISPARNFAAALEGATGTYFMWLADDDWLEPGFVSAAVGVLERDPECLLVSPRARIWSAGGMRDRPGSSFVSKRPAHRIIRYVAAVSYNSEFYGLRRRARATTYELDGSLESDWIHVAGIAAAGTIVGCQEAIINRSVEGASENLPALAAAANAGRIGRRWPHAYIGIAIARRLAAGRPPFDELARYDRYLGTAAVAPIILVRSQVGGAMLRWWRRRRAGARSIVRR